MVSAYAHRAPRDLRPRRAQSATPRSATLAAKSLEEPSLASSQLHPPLFPLSSALPLPPPPLLFAIALPVDVFDEPVEVPLAPPAPVVAPGPEPVLDAIESVVMEEPCAALVLVAPPLPVITAPPSS